MADGSFIVLVLIFKIYLFSGALDIAMLTDRIIFSRSGGFKKLIGGGLLGRVWVKSFL